MPFVSFSAITRRDQAPRCAVEAKFGVYHSKFGDYPNEWVITRDPDPFMLMRPGTLVCPTHWMPLPEPPK